MFSSQGTTILLNYQSTTPYTSPSSLRFKSPRRVGNKVYITEHSCIASLKGGAYSVYFNGELHNCLDLFHSLGTLPASETPEHEVIVLLYLKYGFEYMVSMLNGRFSVVLFDNNVHNDRFVIYVAVDVLRCKSIYVHYEDEIILLTEDAPYENSTRLVGGTYSSFQLSSTVHSVWTPQEKNKRYFHFHFRPFDLMYYEYDPDEVLFSNQIRKQLSLTVNRLYNYYCIKYGKNIGFVIAPPTTENEMIIHDYFAHCIGNFGVLDKPAVVVEINYNGIDFVISDTDGNTDGNTDGKGFYLEYDYRLTNRIYLEGVGGEGCSPLADTAFLQFYFGLPCQYRFNNVFLSSIRVSSRRETSDK